MGSFPSQEQRNVHPTPADGSNRSNPREHDSGVSLSAAGSASAPRPPLTSRSRSRLALLKRSVKGRVLVLGLDGAGKTTLVQQLLSHGDDDPVLVSPPLPAAEAQPPTPPPSRIPHHSIYCVGTDRYVQLVDLPGRRSHRPRWHGAMLGESTILMAAAMMNASATASSSSTLMPTLALNSALSGAVATAASVANSAAAVATSVANSSHAPVPIMPIAGVVFVVDASDRARFPIVAAELVRYQKLRDRRPALHRAPFFLVLNKMDAVDHADHAETQPHADPKDQAAHRRVSRAIRQELKRCFDHQLRMDQKRHPKDYAHLVADAVGNSSGNNFIDGPGNGGGGGGGGGGARARGRLHPSRHSTKAHGVGTALGTGSMTNLAMLARQAALSEANANRKVAMMTSIMEASALDRDGVRAVHEWLKEEIAKHLWS